MSETKHTQGPWQRDGNMIYELMPNGFKRGIAQFKNKWWASITRDSGCTPEEFESVVCKLAAAHDMLAALEAAKLGLEHAMRVCAARDMDGTEQALRNRYNEVVAAIAKAKGGAK